MDPNPFASGSAEPTSVNPYDAPIEPAGTLPGTYRPTVLPTYWFGLVAIGVGSIIIGVASMIVTDMGIEIASFGVVLAAGVFCSILGAAAYGIRFRLRRYSDPAMIPEVSTARLLLRSMLIGALGAFCGLFTFVATCFPMGLLVAQASNGVFLSSVILVCCALGLVVAFFIGWIFAYRSPQM
jgi:hypothetical protein